MSEDVVQKPKKCCSKLWLVLLAIIIAVGAYWFWYAAPFKVKDPSDPRFKKESFRFIDYKSRKDLDAALDLLIPVGATKTEVEKLIVDIGGAESEGVSKYSKGFYLYRYRPWNLFLYELWHLTNCADYIVNVCYEGDNLKLLVSTVPCMDIGIGNFLDKNTLVVCDGKDQDVK